MSEIADTHVLRLTTQIVAAHIGHNQVETNALPNLIRSVYRSLVTVTMPEVMQKDAPTPAVPVKRSVFPDFIICLEDGRKLKTLKRHLKTSYGLSAADYRSKWGLPPNYPMVAPSYAATRSGLAKRIGFGRKRSAENDVIETTEAAEPKANVTMMPARRARGSKG